tara:strand:- start:185 stop:685 length:501 start_codon:yes stop_codon:yes gene_type:complete
MNTIRDNIPIDHLLKQYIDETQEMDIEKKETIVKKEDVVPETLNSSPETEIEKKEEQEQPVINENISFSENVETYDPVNNEISNEPMKDEPSVSESNYYDDEDDGEVLNIGEPISLSFDEELDKPKPVENEIINLDFESIEDETPAQLPVLPKDDIIDLGATDLDL